MVEAISPSDVADWSPGAGCPDSVIEAYNKLIPQYYEGDVAIVYDQDVINSIGDPRTQSAFRNSKTRLGAVEVYKAKGWKVTPCRAKSLTYLLFTKR